ncbi:MAG TPA: copper chaperone PCu(A)C [Rhizomicrobium sp.]|nr:copper chaperone PCu(A)C [Rhizomicrobium sp.]
MLTSRASTFASAFALLCLVPSAHADTGKLTISDAWIRALPASVPSGGYFTLHNGGANAVVLTGAESPACGMLMLHKSENKGGMEAMMDVSEVDVPGGGTVKFAPGGYHLMCMNATPAIKPGATIPVTLTFKDGAKRTAPFAVRNAVGK